MAGRAVEAFPPGVAESLLTYIYRLIDPRNGETFYVGKGIGNRVFSLARSEAQCDADELGDKLTHVLLAQRIQERIQKGEDPKDAFRAVMAEVRAVVSNE